MKKYNLEQLFKELDNSMDERTIQALWKLVVNADHGMITINGLIITWISDLSHDGLHIETMMKIDQLLTR